MLSFYAAKGGVGCSVVAAATAALSARQLPTLLVDLSGDQASLLGLDEARPGVADWFAASAPMPDSLLRLERSVNDSLALLPMGSTSPRPSPDQCRLLAGMLAAEGRQVILDLGTSAMWFMGLLTSSRRTVLVTRACYLALRASRRCPSPDDVVLVAEPGRALRPADVEATIGSPVVAQVRWDPATARAADAGLLAKRLPRALQPLATLVRQEENQ